MNAPNLRQSLIARQTKQRRCLAPGCGKQFTSSCAGERICPECKDARPVMGNPPRATIVA